jgi:hypothetical protein
VAVDVTAALLAAQKARRRQPYVEVRINELHQGVKRLSWTRLYTGAEADSHHGIAFDGNGDMHRISAPSPPTAHAYTSSTARTASTSYASSTATTTAAPGRTPSSYPTPTSSLWPLPGGGLPAQSSASP